VLNQHSQSPPRVARLPDAAEWSGSGILEFYQRGEHWLIAELPSQFTVKSKELAEILELSSNL
jgi:hypothetical protein